MSASRKPIIGITSYLEQASFGIWQQQAALLPRTYLDAVLRAGGIPVVLPPIGDGYAEYVAHLDGLILAGGADLDPAAYHQQPHQETRGVQQYRDDFEFSLLSAALDMNLPVLGVCRGMQLLNVALGGTLHQHLPEANGNNEHRPVPGTFGGCTVKLAPDSRLAAIFGDTTTVRCHHHQATDAPAPALTVTGRATDGTTEAVELPDKDFVLGVQWHPEENPDDDRLFAALVTQARKDKRA
ncbi:MAG TPA: gamma-glutamyl-gamma-aminobutyrate hydrolase family protein [Pseudonocardiaceae bacterium]